MSSIFTHYLSLNIFSMCNLAKLMEKNVLSFTLIYTVQIINEVNHLFRLTSFCISFCVIFMYCYPMLTYLFLDHWEYFCTLRIMSLVCIFFQCFELIFWCYKLNIFIKSNTQFLKMVHEFHDFSGSLTKDYVLEKKTVSLCSHIFLHKENLRSSHIP